MTAGKHPHRRLPPPGDEDPDEDEQERHAEIERVPQPRRLKRPDVAADDPGSGDDDTLQCPQVSDIRAQRRPSGHGHDRPRGREASVQVRRDHDQRDEVGTSDEPDGREESSPFVPARHHDAEGDRHGAEQRHRGEYFGRDPELRDERGCQPPHEGTSAERPFQESDDQVRAHRNHEHQIEIGMSDVDLGDLQRGKPVEKAPGTDALTLCVTRRQSR